MIRDCQGNYGTGKLPAMDAFMAGSFFRDVLLLTGPGNLTMDHFPGKIGLNTKSGVVLNMADGGITPPARDRRCSRASRAPWCNREPCRHR